MRTAFAYAAAQIKKCMDITHRLGGTGYVFWGSREGYETLLNTDMKRELDNMARLLTLAAYADRIGFKGDLYIEPKPKEPTKHQYDFDASTVIGFLRGYGLSGTRQESLPQARYRGRESRNSQSRAYP